MNNWFHWLLVILPAIVAVQVVSLNVYNGGALTKLTPNFIYFIFVEARRSIILLHLRQDTALFSWLRNGPFSGLILKLDSRLLELFIRVWCDLGYFIYYRYCPKRLVNK